MKKTYFNRGIIIALNILFVISLAFSVAWTFAPGKDYTNDYAMYTKVESIESTYELMDFCHNSSITYSINNGQFEMSGVDISFTINKDKCTINNNKHMNYFYLLEKGKTDIIRTEKDANGATVKTYEINILGTDYKLSNGNYTVYNTWPSLIAIVFAVVLAVVEVEYLRCCNRCRRCQYSPCE